MFLQALIPRRYSRIYNMPICRRPLFPFLTLLVLLVPAPVHGHDRRGAFARVDAATPPHNARLQSLLDAAARDGLPGVSLRVKGPGIDFQGAAGIADLLTGEPLTTNHAVYAASLGKTFTATSFLTFMTSPCFLNQAPIIITRTAITSWWA